MLGFEFNPNNFMPNQEESEVSPAKSALQQSEEPKTADSKIEKIKSPDAPKNIEELLALWLKTIRETDDPSQRIELSYYIIKMKQGLGLAKLEAHEVKIEDLEGKDGVTKYDVGYYDTTTREVSLTTETLELPADQIPGILIHESIHAGVINYGRRIYDEGFCEMLTLKILPSARKGDYVKEQSRAEQMFEGQSMDKALELYDFDRPLPLVIFYLGSEWHKRWDKIKGDLSNQEQEPNFNKNLFLAKLLESNKEIEENLKKGLPDLYKKLQQIKFDFKQNGQEILEYLYDQEKL